MHDVARREPRAQRFHRELVPRLGIEQGADERRKHEAVQRAARVEVVYCEEARGDDEGGGVDSRAQRVARGPGRGIW